jgi:hypothetical protein
VADASIGIVGADGVTRQVDTHTQANGDHREGVVVGDATNADTARVLATAPVGTEAGMAVRQVGAIPVPPAASTFQAQITASTTSVVALAARDGRRGAAFHNASSTPCSLKHAATTTVGTADLILQPGQHYELPANSGLRITSDVSAIWETAGTGTLRVTEWFV